MDVLTDILQRSRAAGATFAHSTVHGPWGISFEPGAGLAVHAVLAGEAWTEHAGGPPVQMLPGDYMLVRGDEASALVGESGCEREPLEDFIARTAVPGSPLRFEQPGDGPATVFLCGAYQFSGDLCSPVLEALPSAVHVRPEAGSSARMTLELLAREMDGGAPGRQTLLDRLLDVLLVHALREYFARPEAAAPAWFRALRDREVAAALSLLHDEPDRGWTVASLAHAVGLSRAAFARRFRAIIGEPPLLYLGRWRMALAREALRATDAGLAAIAQEVGYTSEFAFAAAFKRYHGVAPGRWRSRQRLALAS